MQQKLRRRKHWGRRRFKRGWGSESQAKGSARKKVWPSVLNAADGAHETRTEMTTGLRNMAATVTLTCTKPDWSRFKRGGIRGALLQSITRKWGCSCWEKSSIEVFLFCALFGEGKNNSIFTWWSWWPNSNKKKKLCSRELEENTHINVFKNEIYYTCFSITYRVYNRLPVK